MFDVSWQELALLAIVALLVIPPKDLPRFMGMAGRWMRKARMLMNDFQRGLDELAREADLHELRRNANEAGRKAGEPFDLDRFMQERNRVIAPPAPPPASPPQEHE